MSYYTSGGGQCTAAGGCAGGMCCTSDGWCSTLAANCSNVGAAATLTAVHFQNTVGDASCMAASGSWTGAGVGLAPCSNSSLQLWIWDSAVTAPVRPLHLGAVTGPCIGCAGGACATLLLRGANDFMLDEMERSVHDALCVVKRVLESGSVVPGGGAVEAALSVYLEALATGVGAREQVAIAEFAEALLVIPKTLAVNAAKDATELVAKLRAAHAAAQADPAAKGHLAGTGLDLVEGAVRNNLAAGVLEPALSKLKIIQFATEAAITVLRIDDLIRLDPPQEDGER